MTKDERAVELLRDLEAAHAAQEAIRLQAKMFLVAELGFDQRTVMKSPCEALLDAWLAGRGHMPKWRQVA